MHEFSRALRLGSPPGSGMTPPLERGTERADGGAAAGLAAHLGSAGVRACEEGRGAERGSWEDLAAQGQVLAWCGCWKRRGTCSASSRGTERVSFLPFVSLPWASSRALLTFPGRPFSLPVQLSSPTGLWEVLLLVPL